MRIASGFTALEELPWERINDKIERRVLTGEQGMVPKGAKNRRPVGEEFAKKAALLRAEARLARRMPYDLDKDDKLDPMQVLEEAMRHFYRKAKIEESLGRFCDFRIVDKAIETAARIAREIVSFRHPRISAIKLAVADPNADLLRCARLSGAN